MRPHVIFYNRQVGANGIFKLSLMSLDKSSWNAYSYIALGSFFTILSLIGILYFTDIFNLVKSPDNIIDYILTPAVFIIAIIMVWIHMKKDNTEDRSF